MKREDMPGGVGGGDGGNGVASTHGVGGPPDAGTLRDMGEAADEIADLVHMGASFKDLRPSLVLFYEELGRLLEVKE